MGNIFDYLQWRGDVPFGTDPFNEVDNLILAELVYADFEGSVSSSFERTGLKTAREKFFATHSREKAEKSSHHIQRAPLLMDGMISGCRFGGMELAGFMDVLNDDKDMQIAAVTCLLDDGSVYVSFRGTDNTVTGWKEDFNMSYMSDSDGQLSAVRYLNEAGAAFSGPIRVGGHSKGGNFAVYASAFCEKEIQDRIINVYTNDGMGFRSEVMAREGYERILPKVVSIVPDTSVIGMLLMSSAEHVVVKSSSKGFAQHDSMTWQVERNRFAASEKTALGTFIESSQKDWLSKIDDESRETFVNTLFSIFESTGASTFGEMKENRRKSAERMISSLKGLPKEKQDELKAIIGGLIQSGTQAAKDRIRK